MSGLHDDFPPHAQAREEAMLAELPAEYVARIKQARAELRDRFAGYALMGLLAAGDYQAYNRDEAASEAWKQADAMLKARGE